MEFGVVTIVLLIISAALILAGIKVLAQRNWLIQFLRGFSGFALIIVAALLIMSALNIASYSQLMKGDTIANISFKQQTDQSYKATIVNVQSGEESSYDINGDLWQVDARVLRLAFAGATPFYRLDRISGRYFALEQERSSPRSVYALNDDTIGFDLWRIFQGADSGLVSADYGSATFMPMSDGAVFTVAIGVSGLQAAPVNAAAREIVSQWQ